MGTCIGPNFLTASALNGSSSRRQVTSKTLFLCLEAVVSVFEVNNNVPYWNVHDRLNFSSCFLLISNTKHMDTIYAVKNVTLLYHCYNQIITGI